MFTRHFGIYDLKLCFPDTLGQYTEAQLIDVCMDAVVNQCLEQVGFDTRKPIVYIPNKYRTLDKKVIVGYRACGSITQNRAWLNSKMATSIDRILAASETDMSLAYELCSLVGANVQLRDDDAIAEEDDFPKSQYEPDYREVLEEMARLENLRDKIRGSMWDEHGCLKTPVQYQEEAHA